MAWMSMEDEAVAHRRYMADHHLKPFKISRAGVVTDRRTGSIVGVLEKAVVKFPGLLASTQWGAFARGGTEGHRYELGVFPLRREAARELWSRYRENETMLYALGGVA